MSYRGAGYKTLHLAVYKTSLFFRGSEVAGYKTSLFFRSSQVVVYKTLLFSEGPNLQKVFFQISLFIRPHLNFGNSYSEKGLFPDLADYKTSFYFRSPSDERVS